MQGELNDQECLFLVIMYAVSTQFQRRAMTNEKIIEGWNFNKEIHFAVIWQAVNGVLAETKQPTRTTSVLLRVELSRMPEAQAIINGGPEDTDRLEYILKAIDDYPEALAAQHFPLAVSLLNEFISYRIAMPMAEAEKVDTLAERLTFLQKTLSSMTPANVMPVEVLDIDKPLPSLVQQRTSTGIQWLDLMCGGGLQDGDAMLFIAPSGSGKSVFGTMMTFYRAQLQQHAVYLTYEQTIEDDICTDISSRFYAMATGLPKKTFENKNLRTELPADVLNKLDDTRRKLGKFVHTYNLADAKAGFGGLEEIKQIVDQETHWGRRPTLLVVDWVQTCVGRWMAAKQLPDVETTGHMDAFARDFANLCRSEKIHGVLLQQMDTEHQKSRSIEPHHTLAARCKSMGNYCRFAFGVPRMQDNRGQIFRTKATTVGSDCPDTLAIEMRGDLNMFRDISSEFEFDRESGSMVHRSGRSETGPSQGGPSPTMGRVGMP